MKKVVLYVRVSTREQAEEGYSIGAQLEKLRLYCQAREWMIIDEYVDGGFSGASLDRPALRKMIRDCGSNKFDMVLVYKLDRLSRSQKDTLYLIEDVFKHNNIDFSSMQENFDTSTPLGMAMIGILSVFAQLERSQIQERMQMGRDARAESGLYHGGGHAPIGYDYNTNTQMLEINDYEAMQVRKIFQLFIDGNPIESIRKIMHEHYTQKYGSYTSSKTIHNILTNITYSGKIKHGSEIYDGKHEAIISPETFEKTQKLYEIHLKSLPKRDFTPFKSNTLLGGLLYCGKCGSKYGADMYYATYKGIRRKYPNYACYARRGNKMMSKADHCDNKTYKRADLEDAIWNQIFQLEISIESDSDLALPITDERNEEEILSKEIVELDTKIMKLMDLYVLGSVPIDMLSEKIQGLNDDKMDLLDRMDELSEENELDEDELIETIRSARDVKEKGTLAEQKALFEYLIERITIIDDQIEIRWNFE